MKAVWLCFLFSISVTVAGPLSGIDPNVDADVTCRRCHVCSGSFCLDCCCPPSAVTEAACTHNRCCHDRPGPGQCDTCFASFLPGTYTRNALIEGIIRGLIDDLRDLILNGSDDIPVLDPLILDELHLTDDLIPIPGATFSIADTTVTNLGTFIIDHLSVTSPIIPITNTILLEAHIPSIDIDSGHYDLFVTFDGLRIFGTGEAKIRVIEPRINARLVVAIGLSGITVPQCTVSFQLGAFQSEITGMFGHEGASDFVSMFLNNLIPELVKLYEDEITEVLSELVRNVVENFF